jgi:hypothetical protein
MKTLLSFVSASLLAVSFSFAQVPGIPGLSRAPVSTGPQGTTLGANLTSGASGIDLANRVKLRGFVDFDYKNLQNDEAGGVDNDSAGFNTAADLDFLFDFSPITAEVHTRINDDSDLLEQAFIRYSINRDFSISMGRQLTTLGFEADEAPNLYQVSNAYLYGDDIEQDHGGGHGLRRNYVDGIRANFNNGRFGFTIGLHNELYPNAVKGLIAGGAPIKPDPNSTKSGDIGIDLQLALMIMPGFEARLGYAHDSVQEAFPGALDDDDIEQFNAWVAYNDGGLTLALEYDDWDIISIDAWNIMLMGSYQFNNFFALTLRYSHEDFEYSSTNEDDVDRITIGAGFSITDNFGINLEMSHSGVDVKNGGVDSSYDVEEYYAEGIMTF